VWPSTRTHISAKYEKLSAARGTSCLPVCAITWPQSLVSVRAISGTWAVISSPSRRTSLARCGAGVAAQAGNAALAAATAALTSASPPLATSASTSCVAGLTVSK
jgi:hypothetical protein